MLMVICDRASIETLLEHEFAPKRSVVLAFGFDEEASGTYVSRLSIQSSRLWFGRR